MDQETSSWTEGLSRQTQDDIDRLFDEGIDTAIGMLNKTKKLHPIALTLSKNNEISFLWVEPPGEEMPYEDIIPTLKAKLSASRDDIKAAAIIGHVKIDKKYDVIKTFIEHCDGTAFDFYDLFEISGIFKKVKIKQGESFMQDAEKCIWIDSE
jgi:hypothetical protein